jgi:putative aldouronate transport system substrate-binding protein
MRQTRPAVTPTNERAPTSLTRRRVLQGSAAAAASVLAPVIGAGAQGTPGASPSPQASPAAAGGAVVSSVEGVPTAYTQYPAPFTTVTETPGRGGPVSVLALSYSPPPVAKGENQFWQELEARLGVSWEADLVPIDGYNERIATTFAGGDLPDLFFLLPSPARPVIYEAIDQGAFADLTDILTSDEINDYPNLAAYPSYLWDAVRVNGRIWGIPKPVLRNNDPTYYRRDWGDALGFASLTDSQVVHDMLVAMSKNDPDGNGSADTYGLAPFGGGWGGFIINQMFRVPYIWRLNDDGTLVSAIETEEYRQSLEYMVQLYTDGAYHPDTATLNVTQAEELMLAGRTGMSTNGFAAVFGPSGYRQETKAIVPTADLHPIVLPGFEGGQGVTYQTPGFFGFTAISAQAGQDEERLRELLRVINYLVAPFGSEEATFLLYGTPGVHSEELPEGGYSLTEQGTAQRSALVYPFLSENYFYYAGMPDEAILAQQFNEEMAAVAVANPTAGLFSPTNGDAGAELNQYVMDTVTEIVTGRQQISALDTMISEWKSRGGDQIRQEFQDALAQREAGQ